MGCISQYKEGERCCLVENCMKYKKHAWHLWNELVLNHLIMDNLENFINRQFLPDFSVGLIDTGS